MFGGIPRKHPKNSFEDGLWLHPPADLSEAGGKDPLGKPYLSL